MITEEQAMDRLDQTLSKAVGCWGIAIGLTVEKDPRLRSQFEKYKGLAATGLEQVLTEASVLLQRYPSTAPQIKQIRAIALSRLEEIRDEEARQAASRGA